MLPDHRDPRRPAVALHQCPGPGCKDLVSARVALCPDDMERVPEGLRAAIRTTYDRGRGVGRAAHRAAIARAAEALSAMEASR